MRFILAIIFIAFSAYTAWIVWEFGYLSVFQVTLQQHPSTQVLLDLFIGVGLLFVIMLVDHYRSGRSLKKVLPFVLLTGVFGSLGPLLYFIFYPQLLKFKD